MTIPVTLVNTGTNPNDNTGDPAQVAFQKINASLTSLSANAGGVVAVTSPDNSLNVVGSPSNSLALTVAQAFTGAFNIVPGVYLYAALPSASSYTNKYAVTSDQGPVFSNGVFWAILFNPTQGSLAISTNSPLTSAQNGSAYSQQLAATAGILPYTWSLVQKTGANTWAVSSAGLLTGTPGTNETDYLVVQVSDATGAVVQKTLALTTVAALTPAATPTFSPSTGSYSGSQSVTISCSTGSSTIYYTTNGSTPTTGSTVYTTPVSVASSLTLKAIATAAGFTQSAVGSANYVIGAAGVTMGTNFSQTGTGELAYEGLPTFKNGFRSARHLGTSTGLGGTINTAVALTAAGWPAADFCCQLLSGNVLPSWAVGTWKCGFTSLNGGAETISSALGATIANVVHGASTTFDLTPTGANVLFNVTGTTGGVTNIWCYIPPYNTNSGIDNPTTAAAFTNEVIAHYKNYSHIRFMQCVNSWWNTIQATSGNRRTPSNTQVAYNIPNDFPTQDLSGKAQYNFTATPLAGATSGTLSNNWPLATGQYAMMFFNGQWIARFVTLTNGATTCNWSAGGGALPAGTYNAYGTIGYERYPIEWFIALCNACNIGIWITSPFYEDGTNGAAGSWTAAVCTYLNTNWTSAGNIIFEDGNENWNGSYFNLGMSLAQTTIGAYADFAHYWAFRRHTFANVARANLPAGWWGTRAFQVHGAQSAFGNGPFYQQLTYNAMNASWGNPSADVQYTAVAPYTTPTVGASDTISTIETTFTTIQKANRAVHPFEAQTIVGLSMLANGGAIKMCGYEGGGQWNNVNANSNVNAGKTILDPGYTACLQGLYNRSYSTGIDFNTHTGSGLNNAPDTYLGVEDDLQSSANYTGFVANAATSSPAYAAISSYFGGYTRSTVPRNVITGSGFVVNGYDYSENSSDISTTLASFSQSGAQIYPHQQTGYISYLVYWTGASSQTFALAVTFSSVNAGVTTNVELNGTVLFTAVPVTSGAGPSVVNVGNVTLLPRWNYITLGKNGAQVASINQLQFN